MGQTAYLAMRLDGSELSIGDIYNPFAALALTLCFITYWKLQH